MVDQSIFLKRFDTPSIISSKFSLLLWKRGTSLLRIKILFKSINFCFWKIPFFLCFLSQ